VFAVDASRIGAAISYCGDFTGEIDAEIADANEASARAEAVWLRARRSPGLSARQVNRPQAEIVSGCGGWPFVVF
jgi:hypothetical protein